MKLWKRRRGRKTLKRLGSALLVTLLTAIAAIFLFPVALTLTNSLMSGSEIAVNYSALFSSSPSAAAGAGQYGEFVNIKLIPDRVTISQYYEVLVSKQQFLWMFWNSVILVVPIIAGQTVVAALAGYAFAHLRFRFREPLFFIYLVTMLMPFQVTLVPNFIMAEKLGLLNSYGAIILPGIFGAFGVFLLRQFMTYIPVHYIEAARVDGAGHLYIFIRIVLPLSRSGLAALSILAFVDNWNMVEQPLIFLRDAMKAPLSVYLSVIGQGEFGIAFAASTLYMLPMILIALYAENDLVEGIQLSGIKG